MFHKVKNVSALPDFCLSVQFSEGVTKLYDVKPLFEKLPVFRHLKEYPEVFNGVVVDIGGYGIYPVMSCGTMESRLIRHSMG